MWYIADCECGLEGIQPQGFYKTRSHDGGKTEIRLHRGPTTCLTCGKPWKEWPGEQADQAVLEGGNTADGSDEPEPTEDRPPEDQAPESEAEAPEGEAG